MNDKIAIPNFAEPKFYGVNNQPDTVICELRLGNGDAVAFCISPAALMEFGLRCYAQGKLSLGEVADDAALPAIEGRTVN